MDITWFGALMRWFAEFVPRLELMPVNERGVKFLPGGKTTLIKPGLYVYWPVTTNVEHIGVKRRGVSVTQRLTTKDEHTVLCEITVIFWINDAIKAIVDTHDFDDTILEMAQKATVFSIMSRTLKEIPEAMLDETVSREMTERCKSLLKKFGVYVEESFISDFSKTKVFCHEGGGFAVASNDEEDE